VSSVLAVETALIEVAGTHDPARVPWALSQGEAMQLGEDLVASAAPRFAMQVGVVAAYVAERRGEQQGDLVPQVVASSLLAAAGAATLVWARAGIGRDPLGHLVALAVHPVASGLAETFD